MIKMDIVVPSVYISVDKKKTKAVLRAVGNEVARRARALIRSSGGGRKYGSHVASAPGAAPAKLSGKLASSIRVQTKDGKFNSIYVRIVDTALDPKGRPYSKFLETGAVGGGRAKNASRRVHRRRSFEERKAGARPGARVMAPRPYLTTALEQVEQSDIKGRVMTALMSGLKLERR